MRVGRVGIIIVLGVLSRLIRAVPSALLLRGVRGGALTASFLGGRLHVLIMMVRVVLALICLNPRPMPLVTAHAQTPHAQTTCRTAAV